MPDTQSSIFISYARKDSDFVDRLEADLRARDFNTWVDRQKLEGGQDWADMIQRAIDRCQIMLVVLSPDAVASEWVKREIGYAQESGKAIIPLGFRKITQMPIRLEGIQWVEFEASYQRGLDSLLFSLAAPVPVPALRPEAPPVPISAPPESSDLDLVIVRPAPPPPDPDLDALWRSATVARTAGNIELAAVYLQQLVQHDANFGTGLAQQQLSDVSEQLRPIRVQRLRTQARNAAASGDWRQSIGSWQALLADEPDDPEATQGLRGAIRGRAQKAQRDGAWGEEIGAWEALLKLDPDDIDAQEHIPIAEQNQKWTWLYANAQRFVSEGQLDPARDALQTLWSADRAPYYGDPAGITPVVGIQIPPSFEQVKEEQERLAAIERDRLAAEQEEKERQAEIMRRAEEERQRLQQEAEEAERKRKQDEEAERQRQEALVWEKGKRKRFVRGWQESSYATWYGLRSSSMWVWLSVFLTLSGLGATVGLFTRDWRIAIGVTVLAASISYLAGYRYAMGILAFVVAGAAASGLAFAATWYSSGMNWVQTMQTHFLFVRAGSQESLTTEMIFAAVYGAGLAIAVAATVFDAVILRGDGFFALGGLIEFLVITLITCIMLALTVGGGWAIALSVLAVLVWVFALIIVFVVGGAVADWIYIHEFEFATALSPWLGGLLALSIVHAAFLWFLGPALFGIPSQVSVMIVATMLGVSAIAIPVGIVIVWGKFSSSAGGKPLSKA